MDCLRSGTVRRLRLGDIDWTDDHIQFIRSKSRGEETAPLEPGPAMPSRCILRKESPQLQLCYWYLMVLSKPIEQEIAMRYWCFAGMLLQLALWLYQRCCVCKKYSDYGRNSASLHVLVVTRQLGDNEIIAGIIRNQEKYRGCHEQTG